MNSTGNDSPSGQAQDATVTGMFNTDLPAGTMLANRFRIIGLLGIGGMGVVYRAEDTALNIPVALKLLRNEFASRPDAFERFKQELLLSRQVSSQHVVRIHDIAQHEGRWLISMDLIDGEPLDKLLDAKGALEVEEALRFARQIALGLSAAHARQIIHRDLKPSNILIDANGTAYISDFGIARSLGTSGLTRTGSVIGTPDYLSPEQARAEAVDGRSDLYALGLLLYEMLTGKPAFSGGTSAESLTQRLLGPPPPIRKLRSDVPAWVERLLDRLLRVQPSHRLQTADDVVRAIDTREVPRDLRPGKRTFIAVGITALLATVGLLAWKTMPTTAPAIPPPERLLVLPVENATGDASIDAALIGYSETLRQSIAASTDVVVVDGERVDQAVAQLGAADSRIGEIDSGALLKILPATRILRPRIERVNNAYRLTTILHAPGQTESKRVESSNKDFLTAAREFTSNNVQGLQANSSINIDLLPTRMNTLSAFGDGIRQRRNGRLDLSLQKLTETTTQEPKFASAWLAQSQVALLAGKADEAFNAGEQGSLLPLPDRLRTDLLQAKSLADGDAKSLLASQQVRVQKNPDDLDALLRLAFLQGQSGDQVAAIASLRRLLTRDENDPRAWFLLGKNSIMHGEIRPAVDDYLVRALVLYKRGRNLFGEAETVNALGVAYSRLGQTDDAQEQYRKAVELRRSLGDKRGVASSLRNLAQLATIQGQYDDAQSQLQEARGLFEGLGDNDGLNAVDNELGLLAEERGDFVAALAAFRRSLQNREQAEDAEGAAESLNNIGFAQYQLGDYASAQVFWQQALTAYEKLSDPSGIVRAQQNLGTLEIARGRWQEARRLLTTSLNSAERQQMVEETAVSRYYLAELELLEGNIGKSLEQLDRARTLFAEREDQRGLIDAELLRGRILLAAHAIGEFEKLLLKLEPMLKEASDEQRAFAALLRVDLARRKNENAAAKEAASDALSAATASGVQALKLRAAIYQNASVEQTLDAETEKLGNLPLRLEWLAQSINGQLALGNSQAAIKRYREAEAILNKHADAQAAFTLHSLGAQALNQFGDQAKAKAARAKAQAALDHLHRELPENLRAGFDTNPQVVAFKDGSNVQ